MRMRDSSFVILFALGIASAAFASPPVYVRSIGGPGTGVGQLILPTGVAVDAAGDVYVSDSENCRVTRYHADGTYVTHWDACGGGSGGQATGIAVDGAGTVFVALRYGELAMFDADGTLLARVNHDARGHALMEPWGVATSDDGTYLVDYAAEIIYEWQGVSLVSIASGSGCGPAQFHSPVGVARVGANLYVTEYSNRLQKLSAQGSFVAELGSTASCGQIRGYPRMVCGLGADRLVVVDALNHIAEILSTDGSLIESWGGNGSAPGQFNGPFGVVTDAQGQIYVADTWNGRIQVFSFVPTPARSSTWGRLKTIYR